MAMKIKPKVIKLIEVNCPICSHVIRTEKSKDIQCYGCGRRFDL